MWKLEDLVNSLLLSRFGEVRLVGASYVNQTGTEQIGQQSGHLIDDDTHAAARWENFLQAPSVIRFNIP